MTMSSDLEPPLSLEAAKRIIFASPPGTRPLWEIARACSVLTDACEDPEKLNLAEMLRCLDYPGLIAETGARFLYVRTGRDDLGWRAAGANGQPFRTSKADWLKYLQDRGFATPVAPHA